MVRAGQPVASLMRLAARPVGAHSSTSPRSRISRMMRLMEVVLPVPGPPVMMHTPSFTAASTASFWAACSATPSAAS